MKQRKWYVAALLSVLQPGLGHMYCGRFARGLLWFAALCLGALVLTLFRMHSSFHGLLLLSFLFSLFMVALIVDVVVLVAKNKTHSPLYRKPFYYVLFVACCYLVNFLLGVSGFYTVGGIKAYSVPSESMADTLVKGDKFYADMKAYRDHAPKVGDVVLVALKGNKDLTYVRRIIAKPGDTVTLTEQSVFVNGHKVDLLRHAPQGAELGEPMQRKLLVLGEDQYFVVGDNPAKGPDSRFLGPVSRKDILGKPLYLYYSPSISRIGKAL